MFPVRVFIYLFRLYENSRIGKVEAAKNSVREGEDWETGQGMHG